MLAGIGGGERSGRTKASVDDFFFFFYVIDIFVFLFCGGGEGWIGGGVHWYWGRVRVTRGVKYRALSSASASWPLSLFSKEGGGKD